MSRFQFIEVEEGRYAIAVLCWTLRVLQAGYYARICRGASLRAPADAQQTHRILPDPPKSFSATL